MRKVKLGLAIAAVVLLALGTPMTASAISDEGWIVGSFAAQILVRATGVVEITETINADFGAQQKHGIFRHIPVRYRYDDTRDRVYELTVRSVTDATGRSWRYERSEQGSDVVLKIGDPNVNVTGKQTYRISYEVMGALNGFADHDELFWNVNGQWPARTQALSAHVQLERAEITRASCFQGAAGSTEACRVSLAGGAADVASTRLLAPGEQVTLVAAMPKGAVPDPRPILQTRARTFASWWDANAVTVGGAVLVLLVGLGWLARRYLAGRDRGAPETIVPEYEPPEKLRPAEVGLLIDESADTKDLTATIVDLAVRGYLHIEEVAGEGLFGHGRDWVLSRTRSADDALAPYEKVLLEGLFAKGDDVKLSDLRGTFHGVLYSAERDLYSESVSSGWFPMDPDQVRTRWTALAVGLVIIGAAATVGLGLAFGAGLVGLAVVLVAVAVFLVAGAMPRRSAKGRDLLWHIHGFRRYMEVAETDRQRFAERENIFATYLPYAIVFGLVSKWANAFKDIDVQRATQGWYVGPSVMNVAVFSSGLSTFSGSLATAISSTPGASGSSGFGGGGFAGGGGGGGGGGSW
jgi:predicted membrane protein DUF2207